MKKTILITGSTDGIGLLTAQKLAGMGHHVLIHGRSMSKLTTAAGQIGGEVETYCADLSQVEDVHTLGQVILEKHYKLDVLINNAGVLKAKKIMTDIGLDVRFVVNALAPFALTNALLPILPANGRVVNLSSAAQARVDCAAFSGDRALDDMSAYSQSKLAITIWSQVMAERMTKGPVFISVNPGSLLASKMVKEGFGIVGNDLNIGADILVACGLDASFAMASGKYFDNDSGKFARPHLAASDQSHREQVMKAIEAAYAKHYKTSD